MVVVKSGYALCCVVVTAPQAKMRPRSRPTHTEVNMLVLGVSQPHWFSYDGVADPKLQVTFSPGSGHLDCTQNRLLQIALVQCPGLWIFTWAHVHSRSKHLGCRETNSQGSRFTFDSGPIWTLTFRVEGISDVNMEPKTMLSLFF